MQKCWTVIFFCLWEKLFSLLHFFGFRFEDHIQLSSGLSPGSLLRVHTWYQGSNPGWPSARLMPSLLHYSSFLRKPFYYVCLCLWVLRHKNKPPLYTAWYANISIVHNSKTMESNLKRGKYQVKIRHQIMYL